MSSVSADFCRYKTARDCPGTGDLPTLAAETPGQSFIMLAAKPQAGLAPESHLASKSHPHLRIVGDGVR